MHPRLKSLVESIRRVFARPAGLLQAAAGKATGVPSRAARGLVDARVPIAITVFVVGIGWLLVAHPPVAAVGRGEIGVRVNRITGGVDEWREGSVLVVPGLQQMRVFPLRDQTYRAEQMSRADGPAPLQSVEGLSLGIDLQVRYALDPAKVAAMARSLPDDIGTEIVAPEVQGVVYKIIAHYTVREIFSTSGPRSSRRWRPNSGPAWRPTASSCAARRSARSTCRPTTGAAWKACSPRSSRPRR